MGLAVAIFGVALAGFCVWLAVRIFNRRERWAKRLAVGTAIALPVLYLLSFGPVCWIASLDPEDPRPPDIYLPLSYATDISDEIGDALCWYSMLGVPRGRAVILKVYDGELLLDDGQLIPAFVNPPASTPGPPADSN